MAINLAAFPFLCTALSAHERVPFYFIVYCLEVCSFPIILPAEVYVGSS
jgi:hypothetical protein